MLLQADPTVQYALGHHVGRVLYKDLTTESPYNTYTHKGLPPGPIASPGVASLAAAANPATVPYLYFVAGRDGHHEFRTTLQEHTSAIRQVRATPKPKAIPTPIRRLASAAAVKTSSRSTAKAVAAKKPVAKKSTKATTSSKKKATSKTTGTTVSSAR
jgi:hypothetical protein